MLRARSLAFAALVSAVALSTAGPAVPDARTVGKLQPLAAVGWPPSSRSRSCT
jgi:hypothetical protein